MRKYMHLYVPIGMTSYLSTAEVATKAGVHRDTLLRWLRQGRIPEPSRDGRGWRVFTQGEADAVVAHAAQANALVTQSKSISRLKAADWDMATAKTSYLTHNIHPYPAKFIPQIPNMLIQELSSVGDTVADIFCGSGTTLLEALQLKRHAIGLDANPLATLITKAKTTPLDTSALKILAQHRHGCERLAASIEPNTTDLFHNGLPFKSQGWRPDSKVCETWFEPFVVEELAELRSLFHSISNEYARNLCSVVFSSIVVSVSLQDSDTRYVRRKKQIEPGDTVLKYIKQLDSAVSAVEKLSDVIESRFSCNVVTANVLDSPELPQFDLVVTSPPYPNAFSYHLYHRTRLLWLGLDPKPFKDIEIGSHRKYSAKGPRRATVATFSTELQMIFDWLRDQMTDRGHVCFVIGNSTLAGERVDNAALVTKAGADHGFVELARFNRSIATTRKALNPKIGGIKDERIVILQKV
ncbi:MAG: hypothetical protein F4206_14875 [Gammaproteobacteria bacterium]|nr:hypothetical protein [Gammaproteobacteria bacterium]MYG67991.1 hypothetical protein [Gammaproteobacteria bacterium]